MKRDASRIRQELRRTEESRGPHLRRILRERGPLRRGSFYTLKRKCGKPNCHCAKGEGHPGQYLSIKEGGRTRKIYVPLELQPRVSKEAERYRRFRKARAELSKLHRRSLRLIDELERVLETTEEI